MALQFRIRACIIVSIGLLSTVPSVASAMAGGTAFATYTYNIHS